MKRIIEIGTVSSRGQIAIPVDVRKQMALSKGEKIVFAVDGDTLLIKKFNIERTWEEVTKPLRKAAQKAGMKESEAVDIVHRFRKQNK